jgi:hypothetical protein
MSKKGAQHFDKHFDLNFHVINSDNSTFDPEDEEEEKDEEDEEDEEKSSGKPWDELSSSQEMDSDEYLLYYIHALDNDSPEYSEDNLNFESDMKKVKKAKQEYLSNKYCLLTESVYNL